MAATAVLLPPTLPHDYFRIISPSFSVPSDPQVSIPVGVLACQRDPLLRHIETTVISCSVYQPPPPSKKTKNAVAAPTLPSEPILLVTLRDTVLFPEGGGQPTDTGILATGGRDWEVVQVKRHGAQAVHYVVADREEVAMSTLIPGAKVTARLDAKDWDRRYDHMSMHTSQHLLSALLELRLNIPTLSWSLTNFPAPCYVELPRTISPSEIRLIQEEANQLVFEGRKVHVEVEELDWSFEKDVPTLESGRAVGKALPKDYTGGIKRVIVIEGVDRNPCCGTHLPSINNLQLFILPQTESLSRSNTSSTRLHFLCGPRLIAHLTTSHTLLAETGSILSCGAPLVPSRVGQVVEERKKAEKRVSDLEVELAKSLGRSLIDEALKGSSEGSAFKKYLPRIDDGGNALGFLSSIAFTFTTDATVRNLRSPYLVIISSMPSSQTANSTTLVMVFGSEDNMVKKAGILLKERLGVKGGGKGRYSGKYTGVWKDGREGKVIEDLLVELW
ncbi:alanyl-trna synthetase domain containing 1 [Moniliophthora roreri MCA 2997]|uniref:Alanyl-trna synthetase domain containing 1 n=2 Tax=Moniliophthora roreri TaxID=221103 RepID=V2XYQ3_MONRO|nr:alanyl-trna synthetase domain containing 1 [Moniliophthora roreri MCA 2997]KAI3612544.1 alanyl-trna synthetase domain containing 1 [Moniliophthora roreri]